MTVGGVGFQLTSYVIDAQRGYLTRSQVATRVNDILKVLNNEDGNHPMGPGGTGTIGFEGFFYHFLSIAGLRKDAGVELSTIDTALALAGVVTAATFPRRRRYRAYGE